MYPDLSYLFHDLLGTQPDNWLGIFKMFGFVLALAFLASAFFYFIELKRKAEEGIFTFSTEKIIDGAPASWFDLASSCLVGAIVGGKILYARAHFSDFQTDPAAIILSKKMDWMGAAIGLVLLGGFAFWDSWRRRKTVPVEREIQVWPHHLISEMTVWAAVGGILGAKIFDMLDNWESVQANPWESLASGGGLAIYGGLFGGAATVISYILYKKIPLLPAMDACAPALIMGYAVGRVGCQLSGDGDWGIVNTAPKPGWMSWLPDWMWAWNYPQNVLNDGDPIPGCIGHYCSQLAQPVFPTPFYETMLSLVIFGILWSLRKRIRIPGILFMVYLILNGFERWWVEKIRVNVKHDWFGIQLTQAELVAAMLFLGGILGIVILWWRAKKRAI